VSCAAASKLDGHVNNSPKPLAFILVSSLANAYRDNSTAFGRQQLVQGSRKFQFARHLRRPGLYRASLSFEASMASPPPLNTTR
jgi:hypothetical protein